MNRWQAKLAYVINSDTAAVSIGLATLKTFIVLNAGAAITILAFIGQIWSIESSKAVVGELLTTIPFFIGGAVSGSLSSGFAYFYQSIVTAIASNNLDENIAEVKNKKLNIFRHLFMWPMLVFSVLSLLLFVFAARCAISAVGG